MIFQSYKININYIVLTNNLFNVTTEKAMFLYTFKERERK